MGGFDAEFDFCDVDVDYSMRLRRGGWKVEVDPAVEVFHVGGGTPQLLRHRVLHFYKSRWRLLRKHGLMPSPRLARAVILTRLACEKAILEIFGRLLFPSAEVLNDKILGRQGTACLLPRQSSLIRPGSFSIASCERRLDDPRIEAEYQEGASAPDRCPHQRQPLVEVLVEGLRTQWPARSFKEADRKQWRGGALGPFRGLETSPKGGPGQRQLRRAGGNL